MSVPERSAARHWARAAGMEISDGKKKKKKVGGWWKHGRTDQGLVRPPLTPEPGTFSIQPFLGRIKKKKKEKCLNCSPSTLKMDLVAA